MRARATLQAGLAAAAAAALLVVGSGCGGTSSASASGGTGDGAAVTPASAPVFVSIDTDLSSGQWQTVDGLLSKFPGKDKLLQTIQNDLRKSDGLDWQTDIKPALGKELDVVVLDLKSSPAVVGLLQPGDDQKFAALVQKGNAHDSGGSNLVYEKVGDWTVFSNKQSSLDLFKSGSSGAKLADDSTFKTATGKLSSDALAKAYVNGASVMTALQTASPQLGQLLGGGKLVSGVAELVASDNGLKLDGTLTRTGAPKPTPVSTSLVDQIPAPALGALVFNGKGLTEELNRLLGVAGGVSGLGTIGPIFRQLASVLQGDNALYVRSGGIGIPEVTLVTTPDSPDQAMTAIDQLVAQIGSGTKPKPLTIGSVHAQELNLGRISIFYGVEGSHLVVTDQQQAFEDLQASGPKLSADATFKEARAASGMPDTTDGFLYLNLKDSIPLVEGLAQLGGSTIPPAVTSNLAPLRTLTAWTATSGNDTTFAAFLEVK